MLNNSTDYLLEIENFIRKNKRPPRGIEIAEITGKTKQNVYHHIKRLEKMGRIRLERGLIFVEKNKKKV